MPKTESGKIRKVELRAHAIDAARPGGHDWTGNVLQQGELE